MLSLFVVGLVAAVAGAVVTAAATRRPHGPRPPATPQPGPQQEVLDLLPVGCAVVAADGYTVRTANACARELRLVRGDALASPDVRQLVRTALRDSRGAHGRVVLTAPGEPLPPRAVRVAAYRLTDGRVLVVAEDIAESERLESVRRDFVANVSHEMKTPIGALTLLLEAAVDGVAEDSPALGFLDRAGHEVLRMQRLVEDLLELSRLQGAEPLPVRERVELDRVVAEALDRTLPSAQARGIPVVRGGDSGVSVLGNARQLTSALVNLLDNAISYSPAGTRVAVGVHRRDGQVEIAVSDEGPGVAPEHQERIFERFYRVDPARSRATGGTGLGLAIVKHVAANHGGEVRLWSRPGKGSTFTVVLPAPEGPHAGEGREP